MSEGPTFGDHEQRSQEMKEASFELEPGYNVKVFKRGDKMVLFQVEDSRDHKPVGGLDIWLTGQDAAEVDHIYVADELRNTIHLGTKIYVASLDYLLRTRPHVNTITASFITPTSAHIGAKNIPEGWDSEFTLEDALGGRSELLDLEMVKTIDFSDETAVKGEDIEPRWSVAMTLRRLRH